MSNVINWFEVPVANLNRAVEFYSKIFDRKFYITDFGNLRMAFFPMDGEGVGGALCEGEWYKPSLDGTLIYLNANPDLSILLSKVKAAGGKIIMEKKLISKEIGYMALFIDSEGNRVAFHSNK